MSYYFMDTRRLQLFFDTPNVCATFCVLCVFLLLGAFFYSINYEALKFKLFSIFCLLSILISELLLIMTFSRGGIVAFIISMMFLWIFCRKYWIPTFLGLFFAMLLIISNGIERVQSVVNIYDGSIFNRFLIWKGASCMIVDNWFIGAPRKMIGTIYTTWYQPLWLNERYITMVNDYLTIGTSYGLLILFIYIFILILALYLGIKIWIKQKNIFILCISAGLLGYIISACFSTLYKKLEIYSIFCIMGLIIFIYTVVLIKKSQLKIVKNDLYIPIFMALVITCSLFVVGLIFKSQIPYEFRKLSLENNNNDVNLVWYAIPKKQSSAIIIYFYDKESSEERKLERHMIRNLLNLNYVVFSTGVDSGLEGLRIAASLTQKAYAMNNQRLPIFTVGTKSGGKHALILNSNATNMTPSNGVIAINSPTKWPLDSLSVIQHVKNIQSPIYLIDYDEENFDLDKFKDLCKEKKKPVSFDSLVVPIKTVNIIDAEMLKLIENFINKQLQPTLKIK